MSSEKKETDLKKIILKSLAAHKLRSLASLAVIILSIILGVLPPLVLADAIDTITENTMLSILTAAGYFAMLAVSGIADSAREAMIVACGEGITHSLRSAMMAKLHRLPAGYFTCHEAGEISSVQVNDVDAIEDMFSSGIVSMFTDLGTVFATFFVIFTRSRGLGIILLIVLPFLALYTAHVQKKMLAAHTENRRATADASGILPETMHMIRSLHVFRAESFAEKRYDAAVQNSFRAIEKTNFYDAVYSPVILTVSAAVTGVMMSLSGQSGPFRTWFGMSIGTAVALISYVNGIFTPLSSIGMEIQTVQSAAAGWKRVQDFLNEKEMPPAAPAQDRPEAGNAAGIKNVGSSYGGVRSVPEIKNVSSSYAGIHSVLEIKNVSFSYDGVHSVLENFSLDVKKGEFVTLTGRTGAGKSTLFRLLLGLYDPSEGTILINGAAPRSLIDEDRRKVICCVEQKITPIPGTVRDQVTLGNSRFSDEDVRKALQITGLWGTVKKLPGGLDAEYDNSLFSQGQKQLIMIARAVVSDPEILLLDEITSGLDSATEKTVLEALEKVSENRTVISISHRLSDVMSGRLVSLD